VEIRMLVNGHTVTNCSLQRGKALLLMEREKGSLIIDNETKQPVDFSALTENSKVTVFPAVQGG